MQTNGGRDFRGAIAAPQSAEILDYCRELFLLHRPKKPAAQAIRAPVHDNGRSGGAWTETGGTGRSIHDVDLGYFDSSWHERCSTIRT